MIKLYKNRYTILLHSNLYTSAAEDYLYCLFFIVFQLLSFCTRVPACICQSQKSLEFYVQNYKRKRLGKVLHLTKVFVGDCSCCVSSLYTPLSLKTVKHWYYFVRMDTKTNQEYLYLCTYESLHKVYIYVRFAYF